MHRRAFVLILAAASLAACVSHENPDDPGDACSMFEHQDGYFVLDEVKRMIFLVEDFDVATTTARQLRDSMEDLLNLGATWSLHWLARVARITHGREPAPTEPDALYTYHRQRAAEAEAARAKMVS